MSPKLKPALLACAAGVALTAVVCQARVFLRQHAVARSVEAVQTIGGKVVYQASVSINGCPGRMTVFALDMSPADASRRIAAAFGASAFAAGGINAGAFDVIHEERRLRFILLSFEPGSTLAVMVEQAATEAARADAQPVERPSPPWRYPQSRPIFSCRNDDTGCSLYVWTAQAAPSEVREHAARALLSSGWSPALSGANGSTVPAGLLVLVKKQAVCCVSAEPAARPGETRITLLHRNVQTE